MAVFFILLLILVIIGRYVSSDDILDGVEDYYSYEWTAEREWTQEYEWADDNLGYEDFIRWELAMWAPIEAKERRQAEILVRQEEGEARWDAWDVLPTFEPMGAGANFNRLCNTKDGLRARPGGHRDRTAEHGAQKPRAKKWTGTMRGISRSSS